MCFCISFKRFQFAARLVLDSQISVNLIWVSFRESNETKLF
ncbi:hypothetical protein AtNW77_Chr1g0045211 [Arabidopsis thaliana]